MGFILSSHFTIFVTNYITFSFVLVNGFVNSVDAVLEESADSQPLLDVHNHINENGYPRDEALCDCNGQGPWKPLFKPSQLLPDDSSDELRAPHDIENTLAAAATHGHPQTLPGDLHPFANAVSGERQPKKQNHMIHLHLIPHIYVPVLHPVAHPLSFRGQGVLPVHGSVPLTASTPYPFQFPDTDVAVAGHHHHDDDHAQPSYADGAVSSDEQPSLPSPIPPPLSGHESSDDLSHEQVINIGDANYPYYPLSSEGHVPHQYEVHEDTNRDPFYGNLASGSSAKTLQILAPNSPNGIKSSSAAAATTATKIKPVKYVDRSQSSKKHLTYPPHLQPSTRRLREMRPPPLGQKVTWEMQRQSAAASTNTKILPSKSSLDWLFGGGRNTLFDFDTAAYFGMKKHFAIPSPMHFTSSATIAGKRLPSPKIVIYPSNMRMISKRDDRMFKNGLEKTGKF